MATPQPAEQPAGAPVASAALLLFIHARYCSYARPLTALRANADACPKRPSQSR